MKGCGKAISGEYKDGSYWQMDCGDLGRLCKSCSPNSSCLTDVGNKELESLDSNRKINSSSDIPLIDKRKCIAKHDCGADYDGVGDCIEGYEEEDIKESIKRLKEELKERILENVYSKDSVVGINPTIDKIFGDFE